MDRNLQRVVRHRVVVDLGDRLQCTHGNGTVRTLVSQESSKHNGMVRSLPVSKAQDADEVASRLELHLQRPDDRDRERGEKHVGEDVEGYFLSEFFPSVDYTLKIGQWCFLPELKTAKKMNRLTG